MKLQSIVIRFKVLSKCAKLLSLAVVLGVLCVGCGGPSSFSKNDKENSKAASIETVDLPTPTRVEPTVTTTSTATSTATITSTSTVTASPVAPTSTLTPGPTETKVQAKLNNCLPDNYVIEVAQVVGVVDGDTINVSINGTETKARYIGIDTPESGETYSQEASNRNSELVLGKEVFLIKDVSETDRYQRLLRYVFVDGVFVNEALVQEGFAYAKEYPPDISCRDVLSAAQSTANTRSTGIWQSSPTIAVIPTQPPVTSSSSCPNGCTEQVAGCDIKGNINSSGEKIYHTPGSKSYSKTKIDPSNGERWFCTAEEAVANGWRPPRN